METVVVAIADGGDSPDTLATSEGEEKICRGMGEKGIFRSIEHFFGIANKRWDPKTVFAINFPRQANKLSELTGIRHRHYFDLIQDPSLSMAWPTVPSIYQVMRLLFSVNATFTLP
jgi:hypothetical protein